MKWERARTEAQKQQRISEIIGATARLYEKYGFAEITFVSIAKEANFTRSNLYKYFNSKEEIFLEFLKHDIILWRQDLVATLKRKKGYSVGEFASVWLDAQGRHGRMLNLISILYDYLEKKSSIESLTDFKAMAKDEFGILSELLCGLLPALSIENAVKFLNMQLAASIGLFTMTNLSEAQQSVLAYPEFINFRVDYNIYFKEAVEYILQGLLAHK
jgi:AcrR family transcriptional regulator